MLIYSNRPNTEKSMKRKNITCPSMKWKNKCFTRISIQYMSFQRSNNCIRNQMLSMKLVC